MVVKQKNIYDLEDVHVRAFTIYHRVIWKHPVENHHYCGSHQSPFVVLDDGIVKIVLVMAQIWQCLSILVLHL